MQKHSRFLKLGLPDVYQDPTENPDIPEDIGIRFFPTSYFEEPEETELIHQKASKDIFQSIIFRAVGFSTQADDRVQGIILASKRNVAVGAQRGWYKCGLYLSHGDFVPLPVPEKEGMLIGKL